MKLADIAHHLGGELCGDGTVEITGVAGIREAGPGDLTFLANPRYEGHLARTRAGAVLLSPEAPECGRPTVRLSQPYLGFVEALRLLLGEGLPRAQAGVHPSAVVASGAHLDVSVTVGPLVVVEDGARVGAGAILCAQVFLGAGALVGAGCVLHPRATVHARCVLGDRVIVQSGAVIGSDGFGYAWDGTRHRRIPHHGIVVLEDDVEVGANSTIDRATTGETRVGAGAKIDNLVMVAHNVRIGELALLAAQVGIAGSTEVGRRATLAGQVGLAGHLKVGDEAFVMAQSGVDRDIPDGETWFGAPAGERGTIYRELAALRRLPDLLKRVRQLEQQWNEREKESRS